MLLATMALLLPAAGRLDPLIMIPLGLPRGVTGLWLTVAFVAWAWMHDWRKLGRVHPAYLYRRHRVARRLRAAAPMGRHAGMVAARRRMDRLVMGSGFSPFARQKGPRPAKQAVAALRRSPLGSMRPPCPSEPIPRPAHPQRQLPCGAVRYTVADEFQYAMICHCSHVGARPVPRSSRSAASSARSSR